MRSGFLSPESMRRAPGGGNLHTIEGSIHVWVFSWGLYGLTPFPVYIHCPTEHYVPTNWMDVTAAPCILYPQISIWFYRLIIVRSVSHLPFLKKCSDLRWQGEMS